MSAASLDIIWRCCDVTAPILTSGDIERLTPATRALIDRLGFLAEGRTAKYVSCPECHNGHVESYEVLPGVDGETGFFIPCPQHGRVEVDREMLVQRTVSFQPFIDLIVGGLDTTGEPLEIVQGQLWNVGRAALTGQSRPVWLARGLCLGNTREWVEKLPTGRSPIIFVAGSIPSSVLQALSPKQIVDLRSVVFFNENELSLDVAAIHDHLAAEMAQPDDQPKPTRKNAKRASVISSLKKELHEHYLSMKSLLRNAKSTGKPVELTRLTQKDLATRIGETESSVSRAIRQGNDRELELMLKNMDDPDSIRRYSR